MFGERLYQNHKADQDFRPSEITSLVKDISNLQNKILSYLDT